MTPTSFYYIKFLLIFHWHPCWLWLVLRPLYKIFRPEMCENKISCCDPIIIIKDFTLGHSSTIIYMELNISAVQLFLSDISSVWRHSLIISYPGSLVSAGYANVSGFNTLSSNRLDSTLAWRTWMIRHRIECILQVYS